MFLEEKIQQVVNQIDPAYSYLDYGNFKEFILVPQPVVPLVFERCFLMVTDRHLFMLSLMNPSEPKMLIHKNFKTQSNLRVKNKLFLTQDVTIDTGCIVLSNQFENDTELRENDVFCF